MSLYIWIKQIIENIISADWNTIIVTAITTFISTFIGAISAFFLNNQLESIKNINFQLKKLRAYFGSLLSTFDGYERWADSYLEQGDVYSIECNYAKIDNYYNYEEIDFIAEKNIKFYELIFNLQTDINILKEKITVYKENKNEPGTDHKRVAKRQFLENYYEIILMLKNTNRYMQENYRFQKNLINKDLVDKLSKAKEKINKLVKDTQEKSNLADNALFQERMDNKEQEWTC